MYDYSKLERRAILCVDLKSFFASVSCRLLGLDVDTTKLAVVGDINRQGSVVLAATPELKKMGIKTGSRLFEIPQNKDIYVVNPVMKTYIDVSKQISKLFLSYVPYEDLWTYSIDESFLDIQQSLTYFKRTPLEFAEDIQRRIYNHFGLRCTVGIGDNMLLSKYALDLESKKAVNGIGIWHYEDVSDKLWPVKELTDVWGIGQKTAQKLNRYGVQTMYELAHFSKAVLERDFGIIGAELHQHAWGIDLSRIANGYKSKDASFSKSQILLRDYTKLPEVHVLVLEELEDICYRLRKANKMCRTITLSIGYNKDCEEKGFQRAMTFPSPMNAAMKIFPFIREIIRQNYECQPVRSIAIAASNICTEGTLQLSLFESVELDEREQSLNRTIDEIKRKYGKVSIIRASSLQDSSTLHHRNKLIGGHYA